MKQCDVAVLGTGPGGYVAAIRAAQLGGKVIVVEREEIGGVCLNWGCIPTKAYIYSAELCRKMSHAQDFGLKVEGLDVDVPGLIKRKNGIIRRNKGGVNALFKAHGIEVVKGEGVVTAPGRVQAGGEEIAASRGIIVATGSSAAQIPGLETDGERIITSTEALDLTEIPNKVLIIGAGPIGAEFACIWNAFGSEVTLVEMLPHVLPLEDEELCELMRKRFKKLKMDVRTETTVAALDRTRNGVHVTLQGKKPGELDVDYVLVGIGRKYHSEAVAGVQLGVQLGKRGVVLVNERMETSVPGIYAIGDVTGKTMLAHGASSEGLVAAANAMGGDETMDYRVVPSCTFTSPEVAHVGMKESEARDAGIDVKVGRFNFAASGRAATMGETEGLAKVVADAATDEVVGVHVMGPEAGELIAEAAIAMKMEATVAEIAHTIHTHPTLAETLMEAAEDYYGIGIHTPPGH